MKVNMFGHTIIVNVLVYPSARAVAQRVDTLRGTFVCEGNLTDLKIARIKAARQLNVVKDIDGQTSLRGAKGWVEKHFADNGHGVIL